MASAKNMKKTDVSSLQGSVLSMTSQEVIETALKDILVTSNERTGFCRGEPLTDRGKRKQMVKMLALLFIPIIVLWCLSLQSLSDDVSEKLETEKTQVFIRASINLGKMAYRLQKERDLSVFYLSTLGPSTRGFLVREYDETDMALLNLSEWPIDTKGRSEFSSKEAFQIALASHRLHIGTAGHDRYDEMDFYTEVIDLLIGSIYDSMRESKYGTIWRTLVAYVKIITAREYVGLERSLGSVFFVEGRFRRKEDYSMYLTRAFNSKLLFRSANNYSPLVMSIKSYGKQMEEKNITSIIAASRRQIMGYGRVGLSPSIDKGQVLYDTMSLYLDILLEQQQELGDRISERLVANIDAKVQKVTISSILLVLVLLISPFVFMAIHSLTSDIQKFAITLVDKTKELSREKRKTDSLIYQMVPKPVADILKKNGQVDAEYFKEVTIFFSDIVGFAQISTEVTPMEIVTLLNNLYNFMDRTLDRYDVYKVETINDTYMIASGLPQRNGIRHSVEVANLALHLLSTMNDRQAAFLPNKQIALRIGINTGPVVAGVVGSKMPRYCLFGDTVNTASRLESNGAPNKIHISTRTKKALCKHGGYQIQCRGTVYLKGKGNLVTYWLKCKSDSAKSSTIEADETVEPEPQLPGDIVSHLGRNSDGQVSGMSSLHNNVSISNRFTDFSLEEMYDGNVCGNPEQNTPPTVQPQEGYHF